MVVGAVVHVDAEVLAGEESGRSEFEDGQTLSVDEARQVACDSSVVTMLHGSDGSVLDV